MFVCSRLTVTLPSKRCFVRASNPSHGGTHDRDPRRKSPHRFEANDQPRRRCARQAPLEEDTLGRPGHERRRHSVPARRRHRQGARAAAGGGRDHAARLSGECRLRARDAPARVSGRVPGPAHLGARRAGVDQLPRRSRRDARARGQSALHPHALPDLRGGAPLGRALVARPAGPLRPSAASRGVTSEAAQHWADAERREQEEPMSIKQLNPYLNFNGTAAKAIQLYESALGGKTEGLMRFGDVPGMNVAPEHQNRVMHALLRIGEGVIMISDTQPGMPVATEGNVHVCLDFDDVADMTKKFEALAVNGKVTLPPHDTFWGARFGMLTDAFGVRWMFNSQIEKA